MGNNYSVTTSSPITAADKGILAIGSDGTGIRCKVYDIIVSVDVTPADQAAEYEVNRCTDVGTVDGGGAAVTPEPLDPLTIAASCTCNSGTFGTEPVDTANSELLVFALNQRATFRWVAAPGSELIGVAAAGDGIFMRTVTATSATPTISATILFAE